MLLENVVNHISDSPMTFKSTTPKIGKAAGMHNCSMPKTLCKHFLQLQHVNLHLLEQCSIF